MDQKTTKTLEIDEQSRNQGIENAWVVTASGTGRTLAGLLTGFKISGSRLQLLGIDVGKFWKGFPRSIASLSEEICRQLGVTIRFNEQDIPLIEGIYTEPVYGTPLPSCLEAIQLLAQDGDYVFWKKDGNIFRQLPTDDSLNRTFATAVARVTGREARSEPVVNSDGASFLFAGIPATTIGTTDRSLGETGFHRPTDNLDRVIMDRLPEGVEILQLFLAINQ